MQGKTIGSVILAGSILASAIIVRQAMNPEIATIRVEGVARAEVKADLFRWNFDFELVADSKEQMDEMIKSANGNVTKLLTTSGLIDGTDFKISPRQLKKTKDDGKDVFTLTQNYMVRTKKVDEGLKAYNASERLVNQGISLTTGSKPTCEYSQRIQMEEKLTVQALKNAEIQMQKIAKEMGYEIVGIPSLTYSSVNFKSAKDPDEKYGYWNDNPETDIIALVTANTEFKVKKK
ncbi:hypothetical protein FACS1894122_00640 [Alphaproteobacteria bacterium]|nr:hypothetical protein FACS1894122_00640 [Alphaproteobacteria bacterium]